MCVIVKSVYYIVILNLLVTLDHGDLLRFEVDLRTEPILQLLFFSLYAKLLKSLILLFLYCTYTLMNRDFVTVFILIDYLSLGPTRCRVRSRGC